MRGTLITGESGGVKAEDEIKMRLLKKEGSEISEIFLKYGFMQDFVNFGVLNIFVDSVQNVLFL